MGDQKVTGGSCVSCGDPAVARLEVGSARGALEWSLRCRSCVALACTAGSTVSLLPLVDRETTPLVQRVYVTTGYSGDVVEVWLRGRPTTRSAHGACHAARGDGALLALRLLTLALCLLAAACSGSTAGDELIAAPATVEPTPAPEPTSGATVEHPDAGPTRHADASGDAGSPMPDAAEVDAAAPAPDAAQAVDAGDAAPDFVPDSGPDAGSPRSGGPVCVVDGVDYHCGMLAPGSQTDVVQFSVVDAVTSTAQLCGAIDASVCKGSTGPTCILYGVAGHYAGVCR